jgi:hypothetical protein
MFLKDAKFRNYVHKIPNLQIPILNYMNPVTSSQSIFCKF